MHRCDDNCSVDSSGWVKPERAFSVHGLTLTRATGFTARDASDPGFPALLWLGSFFACLLLLPPLPFPIGNSGAHVAPFVALLGVPGSVRAIRRRQAAMPTLALLLLLFLAVLLVSVGFAAAYSGWKIALGSLARVLLFGVGVCLFFHGLAGPRGEEWDALRFARVLFLIGLVGAAFACIDFYFQFHVPAGFAMQLVWLKSGMMRRAQGVFYEASTLGNFCAFFLVMILVAAFPVRRRICPPALLAAGALIFGTALILSGSRASVVAVIVAGCAFSVLRRVRTAGVLAAMAACLGAAAVVRIAVPAFWDNYWFRLAGSATGVWSYPNEVLSGRLANWKVLVDFLMQHPWHLLFGIGYKTIPYTNYIGAHVVADNTWLGLLVETGVIGVLVFAALNAAILRTSLRAARSDQGEAAFFGAWIFCFWCVEMVQMLTADVITYWRVLPVYFWVLATAARESGQ